MSSKYKWAIIGIFLVVKLFTLNLYQVVWWDAAVYIGMGKYAFSFGNAGLWEYTRPIVWPIILGFFWKIGLNTVLIGRITEIAFGGLCILLTYKIAEKLFDRKTALLASLFLAISPAFFFFSGIMLTEIVSTFFALAGIYLFINKKYLFSGALFGLAFLTRFLQLFVFLSLFLAALFYSNKRNTKNLLKASVGFAIVLLPYLILNQILYSDFLFPFIQHIPITKNSGWLNHQPFEFYFLELFKENLLYLLLIPGMAYILKGKSYNKKTIAFAFLVPFVFFSFIKQKEIRFLTIVMPYMYLLISLTLVYLINKSKNNIYKSVIILGIAVSLVFSAYTIYTYYQKESIKRNSYAELENRFANADGRIWTSNPVIAVSSGKKIETLIYYPLFSGEKAIGIGKDIINADFIFLDTCDIVCKPNDRLCEREKNNLLANLKQKMKTSYHSKDNQCDQYIFSR